MNDTDQKREAAGPAISLNRARESVTENDNTTADITLIGEWTREV